MKSVIAFAAIGSLIMLFSAGCDKAADEADKSTSTEQATEKGGLQGHQHGLWWCDRHGIPEKQCAMCVKKLAAEYRAKGDWCVHERPESLCFTCHPENAEKFAQLYEAKYGKKPPARTD